MLRPCVCALLALTVAACQKAAAPLTPAPVKAAAPSLSSMPPVDANNIVSIATNSKDHTTLVAALKAANYVTSVANPGPLTVFAPTDAAFAKLPAGTVENLVKPEHLDELRNILKFHVAPAVYQLADLKDGLDLGMANGKHAVVHVVDGKVMIGDAHVTASVRASNGIVHVVDSVLLPPR